MAVKTIPFRKLEAHTRDIFEAVSAMAKRAGQINSLRSLKFGLQPYETDDGEKGYESSYIEDTDFDNLEKPTTLALEEMLDGKITFEYEKEELPEILDEDEFLGDTSENVEG
jgi:DNA-directed RNA polymerase subunit K/omega